jgi:hypothetical protein
MRLGHQLREACFSPLGRLFERSIKDFLVPLLRDRVGPLSPVGNRPHPDAQVGRVRFIRHAQGLPERVTLRTSPGHRDHNCPRISGTDCHRRARFPWSLAY